MEQGNFASMGTQGELNSQAFLLEILIPGKKGAFAQRSAYTRSRMEIKVSKERLSQEVQRITRQGGKILSIKPLVEEFDVPSNSFPWWIEISTANPKCLYYFGPFESFGEAQSYQAGYIEDLEEEGAQEISVQIKQCQPNVLTQEF